MTATRLVVGVASTLLALTVLAVAVGFIFVYLTSSTPPPVETSPALTVSINLIGGLAFSLVGALIASQRPRHLVGWLFLLTGVFFALGTAADRYAVYAQFVKPDSLPAPVLIASLLNAAWIFQLTLIVLLLILFPSGSPSSRLWRRAAHLVVASSAVAYICFTIQPGTLQDSFQGIDNSLGVNALDGIQAVAMAGLMTFLLLTLAATIGIVFRFAQSAGEEREQFKWFVYAASFVPVFILAHIVAEGVAPGAVETVESLFALVSILLPVAVGFAVLKYRLYDIDVLINRTLVYVPFTGIVIGLYTALVGLFKTLTTDVLEINSDAAVAITTLLVVSILTPLKNQLQALVDRYFKEQKRPATEVNLISARAGSVLQVVDASVFSHQLLDGVTTALGARAARLELRDGSLLIAGSEWEGPWTLSVPVIHQGRELGYLSIAPRLGDRPYDDSEREALERAAAVLAHSLSLDIRSRWVAPI